jgi:membrane protease YdiL (CAAX protease family)
LRYTERESRKKWFQKSKGSIGWNILALFVGILPLPLFLMHYETLEIWHVCLPWVLLALINPWLEELYWRGLLLDYTTNWPNWIAIILTSLNFALNHAVFGVNSALTREKNHNHFNIYYENDLEIGL